MDSLLLNYLCFVSAFIFISFCCCLTRRYDRVEEDDDAFWTSQIEAEEGVMDSLGRLNKEGRKLRRAFILNTIKIQKIKSDGNGTEWKTSLGSILSSSQRRRTSFTLKDEDNLKERVNFSTGTQQIQRPIFKEEERVQERRSSLGNIISNSQRLRRSFTLMLMKDTFDGEYVENPSSPCFICLCEYEPNEEICVSPNHECTHVYHKECMTEWLMAHDECPCCRKDYLEEKTPISDVAMCEICDDKENSSIINVTDGDEYREEILREIESGIVDEVESEASNESIRRTSD